MLDQDPVAAANADNAFTLYYVKFRAAAPKLRVTHTHTPHTHTHTTHTYTHFVYILA